MSMLKELLILSTTPFTHKDRVFISVPKTLTRFQTQQISNIIRVYEKHQLTVLSDNYPSKLKESNHLPHSQIRADINDIVHSNHILFIGDWRKEQECLLGFSIAQATGSGLWEVSRRTRIKPVDPSTVETTSFIIWADRMGFEPTPEV